jgi:hypothetical protein
VHKDVLTGLKTCKALTTLKMSRNSMSVSDSTFLFGSLNYGVITNLNLQDIGAVDEAGSALLAEGLAVRSILRFSPTSSLPSHPSRN